MDSFVYKMVITGGVGSEIDARLPLNTGRGTFSPAATESGLSPDHRSYRSTMGKAAIDAPSAAATSGLSPMLHSGYPPPNKFSAAWTTRTSPGEYWGKTPTYHHQTERAPTQAPQLIRYRDWISKRREELLRSISIQQQELQLAEIEYEAARGGSLGKPEEWLHATDRCGAAHHERKGAQVAASIENCMPTNNDPERSPEVVERQTAMVAEGTRESAMEATTTRDGGAMADVHDAHHAHHGNVQVANESCTLSLAHKTAQTTRTDLDHAQTHSEHTLHVTSHSEQTSHHGTGTYTLQQPCSNPEMIVESRIDWRESIKREGGTLQQQMDENNREGPAALRSAQELKSVEREISVFIEERPSFHANMDKFTNTGEPKPLSGCVWRKDGNDDDDDRGMRTQLIALPTPLHTTRIFTDDSTSQHPPCSEHLFNLSFDENDEDLQEIFTDQNSVAISLAHDDGDSSSPLVNDGSTSVSAIPKPLVCNRRLLDGGGDRDGSGMRQGYYNYIGTGCSCEQDDQPGGGDSFGGVHRRAYNRTPLQPLSSSSVQLRRYDRDRERISEFVCRPEWCNNLERFHTHRGPNPMMPRTCSKRDSGIPTAFRYHRNYRQWCRRRRPPASGGGRRSGSDGARYAALFTFRMLDPFISSSKPTGGTLLARQPTGEANQVARIQLADDKHPLAPDVLDDLNELGTQHHPDGSDKGMISAMFTADGMTLWSAPGMRQRCEDLLFFVAY